jgi:alkanesulfonate monooxygenase SsuD/methylene tetrahydromethanopterin reductase-like flavin-dependent oxidoreductase (luciferase family)
MQFGIHNPSWLFGSDKNEIFEEVKRRAQRAEELGFDWFSAMDHPIQIPMVGEADEPFMESWTVLAALAASTSRIRPATLVTSAAYRHPALLAKMAAGIDIICRGRLRLGFGAICPLRCAAGVLRKDLRLNGLPGNDALKSV